MDNSRGLNGSLLRLKYAKGSSTNSAFSYFNDNKVQVMRVHLESVKHFPIFTIIFIEKKITKRTFTLSGSNWGMRVIFAPIERGA